jgi:hypothetical protein
MRSREVAGGIHGSWNERTPLAGLSSRLAPSAFCLFFLALPATAFADLVVFKTGRTMSVASARLEGDRLTVILREGGEANFPSGVVARVDPDEVPYPVAEVTGTESAMPAVTAPAVDVVLSARPFADIIASAADTHGVDARLVHAVIEAESNYQARARSRKGAKGLMQLMPATARQYAVSDPYDPRTNIEAGVRHLKDLLSRFDLGLALAAYNAGEGAVRRYGGVPPFTETRNYVARILRRVGR